MTKNKATLFVSLIAAMILSTGSFNFVAASDTDNTKNVTIRTEKIENKVMDEASKKLENLSEKFEKSDDPSQKDKILQKMTKVKQDALSKLPTISKERIAEYRAEASTLSDKLLSKNVTYGDKRIVPFSTVGYSSVTDSILVGIEPAYATPENMERYAELIENVVPSHIKVVLQPGEIWTTSSCSSAESSCDPIEGGVNMQVEDHESCTVGLKATYDEQEGFVTAGHCADGSTGDDVGQPFLSRVIGTVIKETFDKRNEYEYCDCAFVASPVSVANKVLGLNDRYYPDHTHTVSDNDWVKMYGAVNGKKIGYVTDWNGDVYLQDHQTRLRHVAIATYSSTYGDSGAPVIEAYSDDPGFAGINVAHSSSGKSVFVKHYKFTSYFSGLSWDF